MANIFLYNTRTRRIEKFKSLHKGRVGIYSCGPTVYDYAHIGNLRTFIFSDILRRTLEYNGYKVRQVMNITDVGHLTSDADEGEDKIEVAARKKKKSAKEIARFYEKAFISDLKKLNLERPEVLPRATEHIAEIIELIRKLEKKGYTYKTSDGLYFDTAKFRDYGKMAHLNLEGQRKCFRTKKNSEKKNSADCALWKFSPPDKKRQMEWDSPWGVGFPGWHIECSAMSVKYLGQPFDIHTGGVDAIGTHHTNEIAQSEAANEKEFARFFIHAEHLIVKGKKMSKSRGNLFTLTDLEAKGFSALDFRFLVLETHYRQKLNFNWKALASAQEGRKKIKNFILSLAKNKKTNSGLSDLKNKFLKAVNNDLNTAKALAILFEVLKSGSREARELALDFDRILGLRLSEIKSERIPSQINKLAQEREKARGIKNFKEADRLRQKIESRGYFVEDTKSGPKISSK